MEVYVVNMVFDVFLVDWLLFFRLLFWFFILFFDFVLVNSVFSVFFIDIVKGGIYFCGMM